MEEDKRTLYCPLAKLNSRGVYENASMCWKEYCAIWNEVEHKCLLRKYLTKPH